MNINEGVAISGFVLARKWRPKNFISVVGQEITVKAIHHALKNDSFHHAYLFTGNRGVGKTTMARLVSKAVNCNFKKSLEPCTTCSICLEIDAGKFPDVIEIDAASNRGVEEIQQILEQTHFFPTIGKKRIIVIDEVHMLSNHAFNAMLKILEEPPDHIIFILATTDPQKIPSTVVSRCLQFVLKNIPVELMTSFIYKVLDSEEIYYEKSAIIRLAQAAGGSMRDALSLVDQAIACGEGKIQTDNVNQMLGLVQNEAINSLVKEIANKDIKKSLTLGSEILASGVSAESVLKELAKIFHKCLVQLTLNDENDDENETIKYLAERVDVETAHLYYQIVTIGRRDLAISPDEFIGLEITIIRLFSFVPRGLIEESSPGANSEETSQDKKKIIMEPINGKNFSETENTGLSFYNQVCPENWLEVVKEFKVDGLVRQFLHQAKLVKVENVEKIKLKFLVPLEVLNEKSLINRVEIYLRNYFEIESLTIEVSVGESKIKNLAETNFEALKKSKLKAQIELEKSNLVTQLIDKFGATMIPDSVGKINLETNEKE